jgi:hypothetical protein
VPVCIRIYLDRENGIARNWLGAPRPVAKDDSAVAAALDLTTQGIEFADAMHLSSTPPGTAFVSFDKSFVRRASRAGAAGISSIS